MSTKANSTKTKALAVLSAILLIALSYTIGKIHGASTKPSITPDYSILESRIIENSKEAEARMIQRMDSIEKQFIKVNEVLSSLPEFDKIETNNYNTYVTKKDSIVTLSNPEQHRLYLRNKKQFWERFKEGYYSEK